MLRCRLLPSYVSHDLLLQGRLHNNLSYQLLLSQWGTSFMHPAHPVLSQMTLSVVLKLGLVLHGHKAPTYGLPAIHIGIYYAQSTLLVSLYSAS